MRANVIEAAEQCGILSLAGVAEPLPLERYLGQRDAQRLLVFCDEAAEIADPLAALKELARVSNRAVIMSVPHEPYFSMMNALRGKNHHIRPRGSDPDHRNLWTRRAFHNFVEQELKIQWIGGSMPWTICIGTKR